MHIIGCIPPIVFTKLVDTYKIWGNYELLYITMNIAILNIPNFAACIHCNIYKRTKSGKTKLQVIIISGPSYELSSSRRAFILSSWRMKKGNEKTDIKKSRTWAGCE